MKRFTISKLKSKAFLAGAISTLAFPILVGLIFADLRNGVHFTYTGYFTTIASFAAWALAYPVSRKIQFEKWSVRRKLVHVLFAIGMICLTTVVFQNPNIVSPALIFGLFVCLLTLDTATEYITGNES